MGGDGNDKLLVAERRQSESHRGAVGFVQSAVLLNSDNIYKLTFKYYVKNEVNCTTIQYPTGESAFHQNTGNAFQTFWSRLLRSELDFTPFKSS